MQYNTILTVTGTDCDCQKISFSDDSIWDNTTLGHKLTATVPAPAGFANSFAYRKIIVTRPDGEKYVYSSLATEPRDEIITTLSPTGIINFDYPFDTADEDGIYTIQLYNFPAWDASVAYKKVSKTVVFYQGVLYMCTTDNTGFDPLSEQSHPTPKWTPYTISTSTDLTRYAVTTKLVVLCRKIMGCYRDFIYNAFCGTVSNPCEDKIKNKDFNTAMKLQVIMEALEIASCDNDWEAVKKMVDMLKKNCDCDAAC
jgi:hypothetical protein